MANIEQKRLSQDSGLAEGALFPDVELSNWDGTLVRPTSGSGIKAFVFVSVYCNFCIDLLPHLAGMQREFALPFRVFCTGDREDHEEMASYFEWSFPVLAVTSVDMEEQFRITHMPFLMLIDEQGRILRKSVIYTHEDFAFFMKQFNESAS